MGASLVVAKGVGKALAKVGVYYARRNDEEFRKARDEAFREWTSELAGALKDVARRQEEQLAGEPARVAEILARLEARDTDKEFRRLRDNIGYEAAREVTAARRRMLAYLEAGSEVSPLTTAQLARVERTVRELDPADVAVLDELARTDRQGSITDRAYLAWQKAGASGAQLSAAGCVSVITSGGAGAGPEVRATQLGRWVLEVLTDYLLVVRAEAPAVRGDG